MSSLVWCSRTDRRSRYSSAYKMGRVLRVRATDLDVFLDQSRVAPGSLRHLYPDAKTQPPTVEDGEDGEES